MQKNEDEPWLPELPPLPGAEDVIPEPEEYVLSSGSRSPSNRKGAALLSVVLLVTIVFGILGFIQPWVIVNRGLSGSPTYSAIDMPVISDIGLAWMAVLVVMAVVGWFLHGKWLLIIGAFCAAFTAVILAGLALLFHIVPHLVPLWLIPKDARSYVPDIASGSGPTFGFVSGVLFIGWFVAAAIVKRPTEQDLGGTLLSRIEQRLDRIGARIRDLVSSRRIGV
jgi:hypothetical protein